MSESRRRFDRAELRLLVLALLSGKPAHGYELARAVEGLARGTYAPSPGVLYPLLAGLRADGLVEDAPPEGKRKRFALTEAGQSLLAAQGDAVDAVRGRLAALAAVRDRTEAAPVRRAMGNLKVALVDRLANSADRDLILAIAALIDDAAQKIERL